ncbi:TPA: transposase [Candidatus Micrarchaeota archaeon]|nr:transposase [Candidatus Micrarchaeota archaeon]
MMKTIQTVVEELPEQRAIFDENLLLMADAQNFVVSSCYDHEEINTFRMHHFNYSVLRERFGLPSQLAVVANKYACSSVKGAIKRKAPRPKFSGRAVHYDSRSSTNLKGIRTARHRHQQNWLFSNWAFFQFETFLKYKGEERGVAVEFVPARNTSKACSVCGSIKKGQRQGSVFRCKTCNVVLHADLNAAKNILHKYQSSRAVVNQPIALQADGASHRL